MKNFKGEIIIRIMKQLKTGVVIIPAYAKVKLVNVPDDVQVIVKQYKKEDKKND